MTTVIVATWSDGVFTLEGKTVTRELAGRSISGLTTDDRGEPIAIVDAHSLCRRGRDGTWHTIATSELELSCCAAARGELYAGTNDARVLRVTGAELELLPGFDATPGREKWYAGTAVVEGRVVGPPLGVRSMSATCDGAVLFANVHVGGIPRSTDGGASWQSTIDIDCDVHEVCAHLSRPNVVIAAAGVGLCVSRDAGRTWTVERRGLHAPHCSAVAFVGDDMLVSASVDPFAPEGAIYRRSIDEDGPLARVGGGLPPWTDGRADTRNIAARDSTVALVDAGGNLHRSEDAGRTWSRSASKFSGASGVLVLLVLLLAACNSESVSITSSEVCAHDSDCALTSLGDDCCDHCGQRAMTNKALVDLRARCKDKHPQCPSIDCPFQPATAKCISNQCAAVH